LKQLTALILTLLIALSALTGVSAQADETIWMEIDKESFTVGESITVTLKTNTTRPVQGFTYQLRYDPVCLQPGIPLSKAAGLNTMAVPQTEGMVEAVFASTTPIDVSGSLSEVKFNTLKNCQTSLKLEKANLVVADKNGMAVTQPGISMGISSLLINVAGTAPVQSDSNAESETAAAQNPEAAAPDAIPSASGAKTANPDGSLGWLLVPLGIWLGLFIFIGLIVVTIQYFRGRRLPPQTLETENVPEPQPEPLPEPQPEPEPAPALRFPALAIKRGPMAGTALPLLNFPCRLGSDPDSDVCLSDPKVAASHAEILADEEGYTLLDLGSGTYLNGRLIKNQQAQLNIGDALRLGGVILVFGPA